jgi:hypothetical protein
MPTAPRALAPADIAAPPAIRITAMMGLRLF